MKVTVSRVLMCALLATLAAGLVTAAWADDAKWENKQLNAGAKEMGKAYKELHTAHVAYLTGYLKNSSQAFEKSVKHFVGAREHFAKAEVTKEESKQIDEVVKHLDAGNKELTDFVKALDKGNPKNAEQKLHKAVEHFDKAMDMM